MTKPERPLVFVGSSVESLAIAYAIQENLEFNAEVTVWSQGLFELTRTTLQSLQNIIDTFDFAVFVFAPDDVARIRNRESSVVRDNVVFELGMFMGKLGSDRTFIVTPRTSADLHLPSDLLGITPATYDPDRRDKNVAAALGPACTRMRRAMEEIGLRATDQIRQDTIAPVAAGIGSELREEIARMLRDQETRIARIVSDFESQLTKFTTADSPIDASSKSLAQTLRKLSPQSIALLQSIRTGHITFDQYKSLRVSPIKSAIEELRDVSLLVPLSGLDDDGKGIPVYWYPSREVFEAVVARIDSLPVPSPEIWEQVREALLRVGIVS